MLNTPSFKKSLIVEQFQGNYLNLHENEAVCRTHMKGFAQRLVLKQRHEDSEMAYWLQVPTCEAGGPGEKIKVLLIYYRCTIAYMFFFS